jgi:hypothetical protein
VSSRQRRDWKRPSRQRRRSVQQARDRERDRGDVVGERPEEVSFDRRQRSAREANRVDGRAQIARDERQVARLDRDVSARADRDPEVGLGKSGRIVDAVADHRHDLSQILEPPDLGHLLGGVDLGEDAVDPDFARDAFRDLPTVSRQQHRGEPELTEIANGLGARGLDRVAHDKRRLERVVDADLDAVGSPTDFDGAPIHASGHTDPRTGQEVGHRRQRSELRSRGRSDRLGDRVATGRQMTELRPSNLSEQP